MPDQNYNPFRQVALVLISLTIIVLGIVFNQAASKSDTLTTAPTGRSITSYLPQPNRSSAVSNQDNNLPTTMGTGSQQTNQNTQTTNPDTTTTDTTPLTPSTDNFSTTVDTLPNQLDMLRRQEFNVAMNYLAESLIPLRQLLALVTTSTFAETAINFDLPEANQLAQAIPRTLDIIPSPTIDTQPTPPSLITTPEIPTSTEIPVWKRITGYAGWERFKQNFRTARQKYAGTGECMITVAGFCLTTW